jgi:hypothetical protein
LKIINVRNKFWMAGWQGGWVAEFLFHVLKTAVNK